MLLSNKKFSNIKNMHTQEFKSAGNSHMPKDYPEETHQHYSEPYEPGE